MLRRKKDPELPISSSSSNVNGSGRGIQMDAPIIRNIKQTSTCTKLSFIFLFFSVFMILYGWRSIVYNRAHVSLTCHMSSCALDVYGPNTPRSHILLSRKQIIRTDYVKLDDKGEITEVLQGSYRPQTGHKAKKVAKYFDSYTLVLKDYNKDEMGDMMEHIDSYSTHQQKSLIPYHQLSSTQLEKIGIAQNATSGEHLCIVRRYWVSNRAWVNYNRLKSYIQGKRNKITIREYKPPSVLGILMIVFGIFFMIFSLILGQFWDDNDHTRESIVAKRKRMESYRQRKAMVSSSPGINSVTSGKRFN